MLWLFAILGVVVVVVIGLVVLGRETARLSSTPRSAVFDLTEAVAFIADRLPDASQARLSHDDVRWILQADADLLEEVDAAATADGDDDAADTLEAALPAVVDEDAAVARILDRADASGRDLEDTDVVAVLDARMDYLVAIGAVGPPVDD